MKKILTLMALVLMGGSIYSKTEFFRMQGYNDIQEAMPAVFYALPSQSSYSELNLNSNALIVPLRKYNDFGMVSKHVQFSFIIEDGSFVMFYENHQMHDKTKDVWEDCPEKLTKKDLSFFNEFKDAVTNYKKDEDFKKEADSKFYTNGKLLLQLMREYPETAYNMWGENGAGLYGEFAYIMFLEAQQNNDKPYSNYGYKVDMELLEVVSDKVPLKIVMYANPKSKTNPDGMGKDIMKLNKKENYWFPKLAAEIVSFTKESDGSYLMILKDMS